MCLALKKVDGLLLNVVTETIQYTHSRSQQPCRQFACYTTVINRDPKRVSAVSVTDRVELTVTASLLAGSS